LKRTGDTAHGLLGRRTQPNLPYFPDEGISEGKARLVLVVRTATELDVVGRGDTSRCVGDDVMELEDRRLAASPCASDERAASLIAQPHCTPDSGRNVTARRGAFAGAGSW
jgi:hypothetical protein